MFRVIISTLQTLLHTRRLSTIVIGLLGAVKIITDALGWHVITNQDVNAITNGLAAVLTILAVVMSHVKNVSTVPTPNAVENNSSVSTTTPEAASDGYARPRM